MSSDFFDVFSSGPLHQPEQSGIDLPMPGTPREDVSKLDVVVKYGVFELGPRGNVELERIMSDCANGKALLGWEKTNFTKEGDTLVVIKYLIPGEKKGVKSSTKKKAV